MKNNEKHQRALNSSKLLGLLRIFRKDRNVSVRYLPLLIQTQNIFQQADGSIILHERSNTILEIRMNDV